MARSLRSREAHLEGDLLFLELVKRSASDVYLGYGYQKHIRWENLYATLLRELG